MPVMQALRHVLASIMQQLSVIFRVKTQSHRVRHFCCRPVEKKTRYHTKLNCNRSIVVTPGECLNPQYVNNHWIQ